MASSENAFLFIGSTQIKFTPMGAPGAPTNLTFTYPRHLSWSAGDVGSSGPTLGYGVDIEPKGPIVTASSPDPTVGGTATITNLTYNIEYTITVYGVNVAGAGEGTTISHSFIYNEATGGSVKDVSNYNGTGQTWRVHTFTGNGTFNVEVAAQPFRVLVVGGGECSHSGSYNGGYSGGAHINDKETLPLGSHSVNIGAGGPRNSGKSGGASKLGSLTGGGGSRSAGVGNPGGGGNQNGSNGYYTNIRGSYEHFAGGGGGGGAFNSGYGVAGRPGGAGGGGTGGHGAGDLDPPGTKADSSGHDATGYGSGGGGRGQAGGDTGTSSTTGAGSSGIVIVAYQIG